MARVFRCGRCREYEKASPYTGKSEHEADVSITYLQHESWEKATHEYELCGGCTAVVKQLLETMPPKPVSG